jgi:hypothetical protein
MIVKLYQTGNLDLETVKDLLFHADKQANFHPENRWLDSYKFGTNKKGHPSILLNIRWIGREPIIMWLVSNQILFEIVSFDILPEEADAIEQSYEARRSQDAMKYMN